jgi:hypothetical protein
MLSTLIKYIPLVLRDEVLRKALQLKRRKWSSSSSSSSPGLIPLLTLREVLSFIHPALAHLDLSAYGSELDDQAMSEVLPHIRNEPISDLKHRLSFLDEDEEYEEDGK